MTTQRFRTPRKRKDWARGDATDTIVASQVAVAGDLLADYKSALGITQNMTVTVMRMIGYIRLLEAGNATTPVEALVHWGIAWVPQAISSATAGDAQIPDPDEDLREAQWLQKGFMFGREASTAVTGKTCDPIEGSLHYLDIRQMRRQPSRDHDLVLIYKTVSSVESSTLQIAAGFDMLLAVD